MIRLTVLPLVPVFVLPSAFPLLSTTNIENSLVVVHAILRQEKTRILSCLPKSTATQIQKSSGLIILDMGWGAFRGVNNDTSRSCYVRPSDPT